ncbi:restriction endonuclease subunit S [Bifidobacterium catenulatum subsp. kashiwanohense]|uniref:restriction endonuclease subunit S n=1 Tax=Bifidobacterium catenulatum TaxID=1686 RepID=UPI003D0510A0
MSRIDDLIAEYCPDGVEYKRLGDVCKIKNGKDYKHLSAGDIPVYGSGGVMDVRVDTSVYNRPTVLLPRKGSIANVFYVDGPFWNVDTIFYTVIDEEQVIPRYLYHVMINAHIENYSTGSAARPSLTQSALNKIEIPVPPLPVQEEIVRILDSFRSLEAELEAELEARRKQYAYYRDQLIRDCPSIRWIPLSEISENCDKSRKPIKKEKRIAGKTPYYGASGVVDYVDGFTHEGDYLLLSEDGANLLARSMPIAYQISGRNWINNHAHVLRIENANLRQLVEMYLNSISLEPYITKGAQPKLTKQRMETIAVPVPSEDYLSRIVEMLTKFYALTTSLTDGLPAEIEARRKQYEYYRDRLLSFDELAV